MARNGDAAPALATAIACLAAPRRQIAGGPPNTPSPVRSVRRYRISAIASTSSAKTTQKTIQVAASAVSPARMALRAWPGHAEGSHSTRLTSEVKLERSGWVRGENDCRRLMFQAREKPAADRPAT